MTDGSPSETPAGSPSGDPRASLAAVRALQSTDRRAAEYDILVATTIECLRSGSRSDAGLLTAVRGVWPGADIPAVSLEAAVAAAEAARLVTRQDGRLTLTLDGYRETETSRAWADETVAGLARLVAEHAEAALFAVG